MISGGEPITIITSILGMVGAIASFAATNNPLSALGMIGPAMGMIGSAVGPAASAAGTLGSTVGGISTPTNIANAGGALGAGMGGMEALSLVPNSAGMFTSAIDPALAAASASMPALSSSISPLAQTLPELAPQIMNATGSPTTQGGGAPTLAPQVTPTSSAQNKLNQTPPNTLNNAGQQLVGPAPTKVPFAKRAGEFLWGKPPDTSMFGDDPQGKMLAAIMQMQYENQKGAMQRGLVGGGLKGLASMTSGLLEDDEYKPNYGYRSKKRMASPSETFRRGHASLGRAPSHSDLLKRIGYKTNA